MMIIVSFVYGLKNKHSVSVINISTATLAKVELEDLTNV